MMYRCSFKDRSRNFWRDESGSYAIEFALVAIPFIVFVIGIIGFSLEYFTQNTLENGMTTASRSLRTGQAQITGQTVAQFKDNVCGVTSETNNNTTTRTEYWLKCSNLQVFVSAHNDWASVNPEPCVKNGNVAVNNASGSDRIAQYSGQDSKIVIVTACYRWEWLTLLPRFGGLNFSNLADGSQMIQTTTVFKSEPYTPPS